MNTVSLDEKQFKDLLKQTLLELFEERGELFSTILAEALENVGLANAIREGRDNDFMSRSEVDAILEG